VAQTARSAPRVVRLSRVLERLADELASGREGPAYSLLADGGGLIAQGRRHWVFDYQRLLLVDGTANSEILSQFVPKLQVRPEIRVQRNARVIQVSNATFYRGSLVRRVPGPNGNGRIEALPRLFEVGDFIEQTARTGKTLVVTNKPVRCALSREDARTSLPISVPYAGPISLISATSGGPTSSQSTRSSSFWGGRAAGNGDLVRHQGANPPGSPRLPRPLQLPNGYAALSDAEREYKAGQRLRSP